MKSFSNVVSKAMSKIFLQKALISNELQEPLDLIIDRLYLGQLSQATDPNILKEYGITHIINACQTENIFEFGIDEALKNIKTDGYETKVNDWKFEFQTPIYCRISISDHVDSKMTKYFEKIFDFIEMALMNPNSKILIHCKAGVSRSPTLVISYLMKKYQMSLDEAFSMVKLKRPRIKPNSGFFKELVAFNESLKVTKI